MSKIKDILEEYKKIMNEISEMQKAVREQPIEAEKEKLWIEIDKKQQEANVLKNVINGPLREAFIEAVKSKAPEMKKEFLEKKTADIDIINEKIEKVKATVEETGYKGYNTLFSRMANNEGECTYEQFKEKITVDNGEQTSVYDEMLKVNAQSATEYEKLLIEVQNKENKLNVETTTLPNGWDSKENYIKSLLAEQKNKLENMANKLSKNVCSKFGKAAIAVKLSENGKTMEKVDDFNKEEAYAWDNLRTPNPLEHLEKEKTRIENFIGDPDTFGEKYIKERLEKYISDIEKYTERKNNIEKKVVGHDKAIEAINGDKLFKEQLTTDNKEEYIGKIVEISVSVDELLKLKAEKKINETDKDTVESIKELESEFIKINSEISEINRNISNLNMQNNNLDKEINEKQAAIKSIGTQLEPITKKKNFFAKFIGMLRGDNKRALELTKTNETLDGEEKAKSLERTGVIEKIRIENNNLANKNKEKEEISTNIRRTRSQIGSGKLNKDLDHVRLSYVINNENQDIDNKTKNILDKQPLLEGKSEEELLEIKAKLKVQAEKLKEILSTEEINSAKKEYSYHKEIDKDIKADLSEEVDKREVDGFYESIDYKIKEDYKKDEDNSR